MILAKLSTLDIVLIISAGVALLIGALIFFFAGLYRVPKNCAIVIEKAREFYAVYDKGTHFKMPIVYQRVATYIIVPQTRRYVANNGNAIDITFQLEDVKKYHYSFIKFEDLMKRIEKENSDINITVLTDSFNRYGLKFISAKKSSY